MPDTFAANEESATAELARIVVERIGIPEVDTPSFEQLLKHYLADLRQVSELRLLAHETDKHVRYYLGLLRPTLTRALAAVLIQASGRSPSQVAERLPPSEFDALTEALFRETGQPLPPPPGTHPSASPERLAQAVEKLISILGHPEGPGIRQRCFELLHTFTDDYGLLRRIYLFNAVRDPTTGTLADEYVRVATTYV